MSADNLEVVRLFREAFNRRDRDALRALVHPDFEFVPLMASVEGRVYRGHDGLMDAIDEFEGDWETFEVLDEEYRDLGDTVLVLGTWRARGRATGIELDSQPGAWVIELRDGLITHTRTYTDRAEGIAAAEQ